MEEYGLTLREIRKQKGITLKELADGICSVSFLSKFERGDCDITLGLMTRLLENLMLSFDEFLYVHNEFQPDQLDQFFQSVRKAYMSRDVDMLKKFKEEQLKKWERYGVDTFHFNALLIEVCESIVDVRYVDDGIKDKNLQLLTDYLFRVEVWGYYEFFLYNGTLLLLEPELVIMLSRTAYEKSARFREFKKIKDSITSILFNTIIYLLGPVNKFNEEFQYKTEISEFFSYLEKIALPEENLLERIYLMQLKGAYEIRIGNKEEGKGKFNQAIKILKELNAESIANNMEQYFKQII